MFQLSGRTAALAGVTLACLAVVAVWIFMPRTTGATECGIASWYDLTSRNAEGKKENPEGLFAAHRTLPLGTRIEVRNLDNGRAADLTVNDRGPYVKGRIIDVTKGAAEKLGFLSDGTAHVRITVLGDTPATIKGGETCPS